nr:response regulator transcription factor [uncultured Acetatifactor sp.]
MKDKKILYVEDDLSLIEGLKYTLEKNDFLVDNARTVEEAYRFFQAGRYDLLLLDVTLPDGMGFDICREVRRTSAVPMIFLTASDEEISIVKGLDMGGDDYITKPFRLGEVLSRINALLRRSTQFSKSDMILASNGIRIDMSERICWKGEAEVPLTLVEYKLLCLFLQNPDRILPRELILDRLWDGNGSYVDDNTLSVYIRRLRRKIEDNPNAPAKLLTEIGFGYKWAGEERETESGI